MTRVILSTTGAGTWTIPSDWDSANNTIELIAAGANGGNQISPGGFPGGGTGGGGGQYAKLANFAASPGDVISFHVGVGAGNTSNSSPAAPQSGDSWWQAATTVFAQGAYPGTSNNSVGGSYHPVGPPYPWTWNDGGSAFNVNAAQSANGGGGAGGPNGAGAAGGQCGGLWEGGAGGGGANGGSTGSGNFNSGGGFIGYGGGNGGANRLGAGGGTGSAGTAGGPGSFAQAGTAGGGGGAGYGNRDGGLPLPGTPFNAWCTAGAPGSTDAVWGGIYGPGSGGGGGGGGDCGAGPVGAVGGDGGQFGGGGGGTSSPSGPVGLGGQGLIVITYHGTGSADGRGRLYTRYIRRVKGLAA